MFGALSKINIVSAHPPHCVLFWIEFQINRYGFANACYCRKHNQAIHEERFGWFECNFNSWFWFERRILILRIPQEKNTLGEHAVSNSSLKYGQLVWNLCITFVKQRKDGHCHERGNIYLRLCSLRVSCLWQNKGLKNTRVT